MRAALAEQPGEEPGLLERIRQFDLERRLALLLTIAGIVSGLATYAVISGAPPYGSGVQTVVVLLNLDLILLLLLGIIIARRLVRLIVERRQGSAGSRLHTRLVALFAVVAAAPAIIVASFSVFFLNSGLEAWFSDQIRSALANSLNVAQAYLEEHKENIRADALAMAADLNREGTELVLNPDLLRRVVDAQAALRSLTEAVVFDSTGDVLARSGLGLTLEIENLPLDAMRQAAAGDVVVLTSDSDDRVRALVRLDGFGDAFLFVGRFVDSKVLGFMQRTQSVNAEYKRLEAQRSGIQITSALIFMIVALLLLFAAVWIGLNFANQLVTPISQLIAGADRVRAGDLLARVPEQGSEHDDLARLSRAFNRMTSQLDSQRRELIEANQELDERRRFTETVLAGVTAGVIGVDAEHRIILPNRSATDFLAGEEGEILGRRIEEVMPGIEPLLADVVRTPDQPVERQLTLIRGGSTLTVLVRVAAQRDAGEVQGYVVTFDDITALLGAQRQAAWAEVARRIAHEVKNPLTPIRLSAERLGRKYQAQIVDDKETFQNLVATIVRQVDTIGRLISEFSAFARMPAAVMRNERLGEIVRDAVLLQQTAYPGLAFAIDLPKEAPIELVCDAPKVSQALTNLLKNSAEVLTEQAERSTSPTIKVRACRKADTVVLEVEDGGPGFPPDRTKLFEPYVTTRSRGTGLGLAIVKKIMEEHSGRVELLTGSAGGGLVRLTFPTRPV